MNMKLKEEGRFISEVYFYYGLVKWRFSRELGKFYTTLISVMDQNFVLSSYR